jgi:hypothetical protein
MFDRTVVCLYSLEPTIGLGFSHAYFPAVAFNDYSIDGQWAFGRHGSGYVALWADGELTLTDSGRHTGQELRSQAGGRFWVCSVGSAAEDGDWASFCAKIKRQTRVLNGHQIQCQTPGGDTLSFDWEGSMVVNGQPADWENFPHYHNLYTHVPFDSDHMIIHKDDHTLSLDLKHGRLTSDGSLMRFDNQVR